MDAERHRHKHHKKHPPKPKPKPHPGDPDCIIDHINRCRKVLGRPPVNKILRGHQHSRAKCPISRTIGDKCYVNLMTTEIYPDDNRIDIITIMHTPEVEDFIHDFETGKLPQFRRKMDRVQVFARRHRDWSRARGG